MNITDNIYLLGGTSYGTLGDIYGVRAPGGLILIDCGTARVGFEIVHEMLAYHQIKDRITHLILTHAHHDHCGSAKRFQEAGAMVIVGEKDVPYCLGGGVRADESPFDDEHAFDAFAPDIAISGDCEMELSGQPFRFITIPGHTPGSLAAQMREGGKSVMFTGDSLCPEGVMMGSVSLGWQGDPNFSRADLVESMMKLMRAQTDMILPAHGVMCLRGGDRLLRLAAKTAFLTLR